MQDGFTALMRAVSKGHVNLVQCLVEAGANLDAADRVSVHVVW
jgi:ankyrin repeat protein